MRIRTIAVFVPVHAPEDDGHVAAHADTTEQWWFHQKRHIQEQVGRTATPKHAERRSFDVTATLGRLLDRGRAETSHRSPSRVYRKGLRSPDDAVGDALV